MYVEVDGSMVLTREEKWKEVKLGRIFKSSDFIKGDEKSGHIKGSQYVAPLGGHQYHVKQLDTLIGS